LHKAERGSVLQVKTYRMAALKDIKGLVTEFIEEKLHDLKKGI